MAADGNIFAQYLRPVRSVQDFTNDMDAAEQNKLTLAASRMKAQQDQQGFADENTFRGLAQQHGSDQNALYRAAMAAGLVGKAQGVRKSMTDQAQAAANLGKTGAETDASKVATTIKKLEHGASILSTAKDQQTYDIAVQTLEATFPGASREMPPQYDPQVVAAKLATGQTIKEKLAAELAQSTLAQTVVRDTQTNDRGVASDATARAGQKNTADIAAAGRAQSAAQHSATLGLQQRKFDADQGAAVADAGGPTQAPLVKKFGKAEAGTRWKADGTLEFIPGGSKDPKSNAGATAKVTDAQDVLSLLDQAGPLVEKATGSYAGYGADQAARVVGQSTEGSRAAAQLKVLEGSLISKMPKMSGPQSDKDVLLYKQMAGQIGDPTIPKDQKVAAMQTIREINERHAGGAAKPAGRTPVRTGRLNGRKVIEYSDGTTAYAD
jgi:hypothetical protein